MVKYGEKLVALQYPPWKAYYLDYNRLKVILEQDDVDPLQHPRGANIGSSYASGLSRLSHRRRPRGSNEPPLSVRFLQTLTQEIETIVTFFLKQQGEIAQELGQDCKQELQDIAETYYTAPTMQYDTDFNNVYTSYTSSLSSIATNSTTLPVENHANKQMRLDRITALRERYHAAGMKLYHLIQFVEVNVTGIRKILKKHDKLMRPRTATPWFFGTENHSLTLTAAVAGADGPIHRSSSGHGPNKNHHRGCLLLKPLLNDTTITALAIMLEEALIQLALWQQAEEQSEKPVTMSERSNHNILTEDNTTRHHRTVSAAQIARPQPPPRPPPLSLPPMVRRSYTDPELLDVSTIAIGSCGSDGSGDSNYSYYADQAAYYRRMFSDSVAHYYQYFVSSPRAVARSSVATPSPLPKAKRQVILQDDVLIKIQVARSRLQQTSEFVEMLAAGSMMTLMGEEDEEDRLRRRRGGPLAPTAQDSFLEDEKEWKELQEKQQQLLEQEEPTCFHRPWISHQLNFLSTFLYMTNYYIVAPTSGSYAQKVGSNVALSSTIIGMTPFAALISTLLYSWWTSHSYKYALVFASVCSVIGNFCYAMGLPQHSLTLVLVGRLLNGFGSARSINRRYIADTYSRSERTAASAYFVTAGALGMAAGPAIASILDIATKRSNSHYWQEENAPGWVMFAMWSLYLICLLLFFQDPPRRQHKHHESEKKEPERSTSTNGESRPLLPAAAHQFSEPVDEQNILSNVVVMTTFLIYFVLKFMLECILSSSGTVTRYYFEWSGTLSGVYLAMLGLLMLPANYGVAVLSRTYEDKDLIVGMQVAMLLGCVAIINFSGSIFHYNLVQYMSASVIIFLSASALEGPTMSLLSKTIPKSWSKGILNVGLLATEAGTFGRVVGDLFLSICGTRGLEYLINSAFGTASVFCAVSLAVSYHFYDRLEPMDKDD